MILKQSARDAVLFGPEVDLSTNTGIEWDVPAGVDYVSIQRRMVGDVAWPSGPTAVVEVKQSIEGGAFQSFSTAITYSTTGYASNPAAAMKFKVYLTAEAM